MVLRSPAASTYAHTESPLEIGHVQIDATLVRRDQPIMLEVMHSFPAGAQASVEYELRLDVWGDRALVPGGVPVAIDLGPGAVLKVTGVTRFLAYGPADAFIGPVQVEDAGWNGAAEAGEHVIVIPEEAPWATLSGLNLTGTMRVLDLVRTQSAPRPVTGPAAIDWTFQIDTVPLHVGIYETNVSVFVAQEGDSSARIAGPDGVVAEGPIGCGGACVQGSDHFVTLRSPTGDPGNMVGAYQVHYEPTPGAGTQIGHFTTTYKR